MGLWTFKIQTVPARLMKRPYLSLKIQKVLNSSGPFWRFRNGESWKEWSCFQK